MLHTRIRKALNVTALALGAFAVLAAAFALVLDKSLPYRIGPDQYARYLWVGRLVRVAFAVAVLALVLGLVSRQRLPIGFALLTPVCLFFIGGIHSGPNSQTWCFNNLRQIDKAKEQFAKKGELTNGATVTVGQIAPYLRNGFADPQCAEHGSYTINPIGLEPYCSFHGTISEMEAGRAPK